MGLNIDAYSSAQITLYAQSNDTILIPHSGINIVYLNTNLCAFGIDKNNSSKYKSQMVSAYLELVTVTQTTT